MRSSPCSVKNGRGDVIYRHGCQITGSSCGEGEAMHLLCFLFYSTLQHSTAWRCVLSCGGGRGGQDMGCFPLCSQLHLRPRPILSSASSFVFNPSSSYAHLSSINLGCLSDPERSQCAWLKWIPGCCTSNYSCWRPLTPFHSPSTSLPPQVTWYMI